MLARVDLRGFPRPARRCSRRPAGGRRRRRGRRARSSPRCATGGDAARPRAHRALRRLRIDDIAVPAGRAGGRRSTGSIPTLRAALEFARDQIVAWHEAQRERGARARALRRPRARARGARRPGRLLRPGRAGAARVVGADDRAPGAGRRGRPGRRCARRRGPTGPSHDAMLAAAALAGVDEVYRVGGAQAIAALAYGTETIRPVDVIVGPGQRVRRGGEAPGRDRRRRSTASRDRRRSRSSPTRPSTRPGSRPTCSRRPSTVRAARRRSSPGTRTSPSASSSRSTRCSASTARRDEAEATLRAGGRVVLVDGPRRRRWTPRTRSHPSTSS